MKGSLLQNIKKSLKITVGCSLLVVGIIAASFSPNENSVKDYNKASNNYKYKYRYNYDTNHCNGTYCYEHKYRYNYSYNYSKNNEIGPKQIGIRYKNEKQQKIRREFRFKFKINVSEIVKKIRKNRHQFMNQIRIRLQEKKQQIMQYRERIRLELREHGRLDNETRNEVITLIQQTLADKISYLLSLVMNTSLEEEYAPKLQDLLNNINNATDVRSLKILVREYVLLKREIIGNKEIQEKINQLQ